MIDYNLEDIAQIALTRREENSAFRIYLEAQDSEKIDKIVHRLDEKITPQIDCAECGSCCHNVRPIATYEEMKPFVRDEDYETLKYVQGLTCKNLDGTRCTVYLERPEVCKDFPYLDRPEFLSRTVSAFQNYELCPIVYNLIEDMKVELDWKCSNN
jgi:Fe-S-cluster containining protein